MQFWNIVIVNDQAEKRVVSRSLDKEYATIIGIPEFYNKAIELALGKVIISLMTEECLKN